MSYIFKNKNTVDVSLYVVSVETLEMKPTSAKMSECDFKADFDSQTDHNPTHYVFRSELAARCWLYENKPAKATTYRNNAGIARVKYEVMILEKYSIAYSPDTADWLTDFMADPVNEGISDETIEFIVSEDED